MDLWALGVCVYQWAFGQLPFRGSTVLETFAAISSAEPPDAPPESSVSTALQDVIAQVDGRAYPGAEPSSQTLTLSMNPF